MKLFLTCVAGATLAVVGVGLAGPVSAVTVTPTIYLDYSNVIATGSTIIINRLPIQKSDGTIIYKDVTIQLKTDANGLLTVSPSTPAQPPSPPVLGANFRSGVYGKPSPGGADDGFTLAGPNPVPGHTVSKWTTFHAPGLQQFCDAANTVFYVGSLSDNPFYAGRLKPAGITNVEYSYGIVAADAGCTNHPFATGDLVGFSQSGTVITLATFTNSSGKDQGIPVNLTTFKLH